MHNEVGWQLTEHQKLLDLIGVDNQEPTDLGEILPYEIHRNLTYVTLRFVGGLLKYEGQAEPVASQGSRHAHVDAERLAFGTDFVR